jgi:hypothetical protein
MMASIDSEHEPSLTSLHIDCTKPARRLLLRCSSRFLRDRNLSKSFQARLDAERAEDGIERAGPTITPQALKTFARTARKRMRTDGGGYRRDHLRALAQRIEVDQKELRIMGSKSALLRTLVAASSAKTADFGVPSSVPKWRARHDSNV